MDSIQFHELFDDFGLVPSYDKPAVKAYCKEQRGKRGVYALFDQNFQCLYVGSSIDLKRRLDEHLYCNKLKGHQEEVLFVGVRYVQEKDVTVPERTYIRELNPKLNVMRYPLPRVRRK